MRRINDLLHSCGMKSNSQRVRPAASNRGFKNLHALRQSAARRPTLFIGRRVLSELNIMPLVPFSESFDRWRSWSRTLSLGGHIPHKRDTPLRGSSGKLRKSPSWFHLLGRCISRGRDRAELHRRVRLIQALQRGSSLPSPSLPASGT
jgi:hypothetical protein